MAGRCYLFFVVLCTVNCISSGNLLRVHVTFTIKSYHDRACMHDTNFIIVIPLHDKLLAPLCVNADSI